MQGGRLSARATDGSCTTRVPKVGRATEANPTDDACMNSSTDVATAPSQGPPCGRSDTDLASLAWIRTGWESLDS